MEGILAKLQFVLTIFEHRLRIDLLVSGKRYVNVPPQESSDTLAQTALSPVPNHSPEMVSGANSSPYPVVQRLLRVINMDSSLQVIDSWTDFMQSVVQAPIGVSCLP